MTITIKYSAQLFALELNALIILHEFRVEGAAAVSVFFFALIDNERVAAIVGL